MKTIIIKREGDSHSMILPAVSIILPDNSFKTKALGNNRNQFGRDMSTDLFREYFEDAIRKDVRIINPLVPYKVYESTTDAKECNIIVINYYMGNDYKDVKEYLGGKMFVIDDEIPVSERIPNTNPPEYKFGRFNSILQYTGWEHIPKSVEKAKYEGDCYSRIELNDKCKYTMLKLTETREPYIK